MNKETFRANLNQKFWNGKFIELHSGDLEDIIDCLEDNPVPSIDNSKFIETLMPEFYNGEVLEIPTDKMNGILNKFKLQNGVETDNEEPKKCKNPSGLCTCSLGYSCK